MRNIDTRRLDKCLLEGSSPHSRNASYTEIAARLQLMDIVKNSVPSDQYKEDGIIYPNDWRKYARKIDSEIEEMEKMGLDRSRFINTCQGIGKAFTNRMEQVLKEIKTEVDKNNKKTRNEYLASDRRSVKDWGKIERESNQGRSCKEREISSPVKYPGRE